MQAEQINSSLLEIVGLGQKTSFALLRSFLSGGGFADRMRIAFGSSIDAEAASTFIDDIVSGRESLRISILENNELNGAYGAFDQSTGTIFLSKDFVLANSADPSKISAVLLEEFGHLLDAKFNPTDALGDEGAIFSRLVTGTRSPKRPSRRCDPKTIMEPPSSTARPWRWNSPPLTAR